MDFKERKEIIEFLNRFEENNATENWEYNDVKVWPILKSTLFLRIFWGISVKPKEVSRLLLIFYAFKNFLKRKINSFKFQKLKLNSTDFLFFSGSNFRENFKGESFNKFYDPIGDYFINKNKKILFLEYGKYTEEKTYRNRGLNIQFIYHHFESLYEKNEVDFSNWDGIDGFVSFVEDKINFPDFSTRSEIEVTLNKVFWWKKTFDWVLDQTHPKKVFLLSYYNIPCFGLLISARHKGIECIDIQHGSQGVYHPAYSGFKGDYFILPNLFWLWDAQTESLLTKNLKYPNLKTLNGGNPWHYFLNHSTFYSRLNQPSVLLTLQPVNSPIDEYIYEAISQSKREIAWLFRLHPRIGYSTRNQIISRLKALNVYDDSLWEKANQTPLPILLKEVDLHISKFSGCIAEAADLGTFSIILEKNGEITYEYLINNGLAEGEIDSNTQKLLSAIQRNLGKKRKIQSNNLDYVLDLLL
ncbi:hypothetical protein SAMN04488104_100786 [Algoriphagus faecimaris]|uniref:CDP-Glycerol:Poly(Glycerophosphate) glycerophosphotransferase n=1 Tax=Algoriphagus faecimaris TaxID=686796 RepID=A0A1G6PWL9_9BACT|nr:hypothetical protein [Algoriphagus faecimaris]SDC84438.1 hypothetical protein SAMN04488104_100786 [Algoriphagus faecimaris]